MKVRSGPVVWALIVRRSVPGVFSQTDCSESRLKFPVVVAKVIYPKIYGPLPSIWLLRTDCLSFVRLQDGQRSVLHRFLHELLVEISSYRQQEICPKFLINFLIDSLLRQELLFWPENRITRVQATSSQVTKFRESFGLQLLDHCNHLLLSRRPDSIS